MEKTLEINERVRIPLGFAATLGVFCLSTTVTIVTAIIIGQQTRADVEEIKRDRTHRIEVFTENWTEVKVELGIVRAQQIEIKKQLDRMELSAHNGR